MLRCLSRQPLHDVVVTVHCDLPLTVDHSIVHVTQIGEHSVNRGVLQQVHSFGVFVWCLCTISLPAGLARKYKLSDFTYDSHVRVLANESVVAWQCRCSSFQFEGRGLRFFHAMLKLYIAIPQCSVELQCFSSASTKVSICSDVTLQSSFSGLVN